MKKKLNFQKIIYNSFMSFFFFLNLSILLYKFHLHLKEAPCCLGFMIMSNYNEVEVVSFKSYHVCV